MTPWSAILAEARDDRTLYVLAGYAAALALVRTLGTGEPHRVKAMTFFVVLHAIFVPVAGVLRIDGGNPYRDVHLPCVMFAGIALVGLAGGVLFTVIMPRVRLGTPRILQDVLVATSAVIAVLVIASRNQFNLSSLIATSAVLTAVIGFALQDTLQNIMGGLAIQLDNSIRVGDWIKFNDVQGQVKEVRWRHTAVETRNWETLIIPNSVLMKTQLEVLGRRTGQPVQLRRWVWFNVDYRFNPKEVIRVVTEAITSTPIENVAQTPPPNCVLMELGESFGRYAVRYWLTELLLDDPTDSKVRVCLYYALKRASIPLSLPAHALFITEESPDRKALKTQEDLEQRIAALAAVDLFSHISDDERAQLAQSLRRAPFAQGETMTRQGAVAHWLYLIIHGEAAVRVTEAGITREVARLKDGEVFGEMSLLTGECRSATVVALTDVECYRLDKSAFQQILSARPQLADHLAGILARRTIELHTVRENLDQEARARRLAAEKLDLLGKIRGFFGLGEGSTRAAG